MEFIDKKEIKDRTECRELIDEKKLQKKNQKKNKKSGSAHETRCVCYYDCSAQCCI